MPVTQLYVEGSLDQRLLTGILSGQVAVAARGSKDDLPHIVRREMDDGKKGVAYLRDRDFDSEPPPVPARQIAVDRKRQAIILGYRWDRTEIENYLLEPAIACAALEVDPVAWSEELDKAAALLCAYTAGRWAFGQLRFRTRRINRINTHPDDMSGQVFPLPKSLKEADVRAWLTMAVSQIRAEVSREFDVTAITQHFERYKTMLEGKPGGEILRWHSGKNLFGVLADYFQSIGINNSTEAMERVLSWLDTPQGMEVALSLIPEWNSLATVLNR